MNCTHIPITSSEFGSQANMKPTKLTHLLLGIALAGAGATAWAGAIEEIPPVVNLSAAHRLTNEAWCGDNGSAVVLEMMRGGQWSPIADRTLFAVRLNNQPLPIGKARFGDNTVTVCVKNHASWSILAIGPGSLGEIIMIETSSAGFGEPAARPMTTNIAPSILALNLTAAQASASQSMLEAVRFGLGAMDEVNRMPDMFSSETHKRIIETFSVKFSSAAACMRMAFRDDLVAEAGARKVLEIALTSQEARNAWEKLVETAPKIPAPPCEQ